MNEWFNVCVLHGDNESEPNLLIHFLQMQMHRKAHLIISIITSVILAVLLREAPQEDLFLFFFIFVFSFVTHSVSHKIIYFLLLHRQRKQTLIWLCVYFTVCFYYVGIKVLINWFLFFNRLDLCVRLLECISLI